MQRGAPQRRREAADGLVMGIILLAKSIEEGPGDDAKGYTDDKQVFHTGKVVHCGKNFLSPEIYPYSGQQQQAVGRKRGKKVNVSAPKQKNLNDRRAKRYFIQLANSNFGVGDLVVHLTYCPGVSAGEPEEEAAKIVAKYLRRVAYLRKKRGLPPLKYLLVTQIGRKKDGTHRHHPSRSDERRTGPRRGGKPVVGDQGHKGPGAGHVRMGKR